MKHEKIVPGSKYTGTDLGNPGVDMLGQRLEREHYTGDELAALASFDYRNHLGHASERSRAGDRLRKGARVVLVSVGLVGAAFGLGEAMGNGPKPVKHHFEHINYVKEGVQPASVVDYLHNQNR